MHDLAYAALAVLLLGIGIGWFLGYRDRHKLIAQLRQLIKTQSGVIEQQRKVIGQLRHGKEQSRDDPQHL